jgi:hypothetical protein
VRMLRHTATARRFGPFSAPVLGRDVLALPPLMTGGPMASSARSALDRGSRGRGQAARLPIRGFSPVGMQEV